ncbi:GtrA-like protein [Vibrio thalassae]|uniref:GtrA-like protein n=1 Tax=Vibrio thalassae TaxID=1243014 RepID=A0A240EMP6_9VIBR|nr:GtrA family protein [Vibrio thalassae]SNX49771.1 GtrA-like protein [Vibrio thalassae]
MPNIYASRQFVMFLCTGGFAAAVNFGSRIFFSQYVSFSTAIVLAYLMGMVTAFALARVFVFTDSKNSVVRSAFYFTLINIAAIAQTWIVSMLLAYYILPFFNISKYIHEISHLIGVLVPVFTSFIGHKSLSFRE